VKGGRLLSRHLLPIPTGYGPATHTVVGWDAQTMTYFLHISPPKGSTDEAVLLGLGHAELYDPDEFLEVMEQHGIDAPDQLIAELYWDRDLGRSNRVIDWRSGQPVQLL
jgi:hypothetical protein